jgi:hypothetical protein
MGAEKKLEKRCTDLAKANGWYTRKWASPSHRGVPDRLFLKDGHWFAIEFKAPGNEPTPLQYDEIDQIQTHGGVAMWVDDVEGFKKLLKIHT